MSPRVYVRKFDYDEARRRVEDGESQASLAREYGVSDARIGQVVNPEVGARAAARARAYRWKCPDCGADTRGKGVRCNPCAALVQATSVRPDTLFCPACETWKVDDGFAFDSGTTGVRRGRKRYCRECDTKKRQDYRRRNYEREQAYWAEYAAARRRRSAA